MPICKNYAGSWPKSQVLLTLLIISLILIGSFVYAKDECEDQDLEKCQEEIEKYQERYESVSQKLSYVRDKMEGVSQMISNLSSELSVTQAEIDSLQADINSVLQELSAINQTLEQKRGSLQDKILLRNQVVRRYYQEARLSTLELFFTSLPNPSQNLTGFQASSLAYVFQKSLGTEAVRIIEILNMEIDGYEVDKKEAENLKIGLEKAQADLVTLKANLATKKASAEGDLGKLEEEQSGIEEELKDLQASIDRLTALQQSIISAKSGEGVVSGYEAPEYELPNPPFKPAFAAMSYGAYTHYNGMSQYGAKGRAQDGQNYKKILKFYYKVDVEEKDNFPDKLCVEGYGKMDFDKYLYGIAEMPDTWPTDALKAQAIAARTYAYRYTKDGGCICTTQSCQVFSKSKSDNPPSRWKDAVDDTEDTILKDPKTSQYSSTTGGYINNIGWDLDGDNWPEDAYEKKAKSPWFYKAWYTKTYRNDSGTCGLSTPWLSKEEMVDILNAWVVWRKGSGDEKDHISPVTTSCWGGDPYSYSKMAEKADKYGNKYTSISKVWVDIGSGGSTSKVHFQTNKGELTINGNEFKAVFNLRAPGFVAFRSRLFDIEMEK